MSGLQAPISAYLRRGLRGYFHTECWLLHWLWVNDNTRYHWPTTSGSFHPTIIKHEPRHGASTVFQFFGVTRPGFESRIPASVARVLLPGPSQPFMWNQVLDQWILPFS